MVCILTGPQLSLPGGQHPDNGCSGLDNNQESQLDWSEIGFWEETQQRGIGTCRLIGDMNFMYRPDAHWMMHYTAWTNYANYMKIKFDMDLEASAPDEWKMVIAEDWLGQHPENDEQLFNTMLGL